MLVLFSCIPANHLKYFSWILGTIFQDFKSFPGLVAQLWRSTRLRQFISTIYCAHLLQCSSLDFRIADHTRYPHARTGVGVWLRETKFNVLCLDPVQGGPCAGRKNRKTPAGCTRDQYTSVIITGRPIAPNDDTQHNEHDVKKRDYETVFRDSGS